MKDFATHTHSPLRILIVDDEHLARSLVRTLVEQDKALQVVGESSNGEAV